MANLTDFRNPTDPKAWLKGFDLRTKQAVLEAQGFGKTEAEKALLSLEYHIEEKSGPVQVYLRQMVELVRAATTVNDTRQVQQELRALVTTIRKEDASLSQKEKENIEVFAQALEKTLTARTQIRTRAGRMMQNVGRAMANASRSARGSLAETLTSSKGATFGLIAKLIAPRETREREPNQFMQSMLDANASIMKTIASNRDRLMASDRESSEPRPVETEPETTFEPEETPVAAPRTPRRVKPAKPKGKVDKLGRLHDAQGRFIKVEDAVVGEGGSGIANAALLRTNKNIITELKRLNKTVEAYVKDDMARKQRTAAIADETETGNAVEMLRRGTGETADKKKTGGLLSALMTGLRLAIGKAFGLIKAVALGALTAIKGALTGLVGAMKTALLGLLHGIKTGLPRLLSGAGGLLSSIGTFVASAAIPSLVLAAQAKISDELAKVFLELHNKYPELNRSDKGLQDDVQAVTDAKKNVATVLDPKSPELKPVGGYEDEVDFNARRKAGMSRAEWSAADERTKQKYIDKLPKFLRDRRRAAATPAGPEQAPESSTMPATATSQVDVTGRTDVTPLAPLSLAGRISNLKVPEPISPVRRPPNPQDMHMSARGIQKLKRREGRRLKAYWDVNGWAIAYGQHTWKGKPVVQGQTITESELDAELVRQLHEKYEPYVKRNLQTPVSQDEFDAMVSVAWNSPAAGANLARKRNTRELTERDFLASGTVDGKPRADLQDRRRGEFAQYQIGALAANRAAEPLRTYAANQSGAGATIVAPQTINAPATTVAQTTIVPMPLTTDNPDATMRAIRSASGV